MKSQNLLEGCGLGIALTLSYIWEPLAPAHIQGLYLRVLPVSSVAGGAVLDLIAVSLLGWAAITWMEHFDGTSKTLLWALLAAIVPAIVVRSALRLAEVNFPVPSAFTMTAALLIPVIAVWRLWPDGYRRLVGATRICYLCVGLCILWVLPELSYAAMHREPPDRMETHRAVPARQMAQGETRIVWLLLDELSYDQTFDHRQPGLKLANFDAMRAVSTSFANIQPAGYYTDEIIPSLLTGQPIAEIESSKDGDLLEKQSSDAEWERFDHHATLFGDAEHKGWSTGIVGWFNPYCRLLGTLVDFCVWEPESRLFPGHMNASNTAWQNALAPLGAKFHVDADTRLSAEHGRAYELLMARALQMIQSGNERLVFIHLPAPHPPGIYDRVKGRMQVGGSYMDNLVLADKTVGEVRSAIDATPFATNTILIVSSDHSMRVPKWRGGASWTAEDERVFGKHFDTRPVLMVHFAGEQTGSTISTPFVELRTHDMIESMIDGRMSAQADLGSWLGADHDARGD